MFAFRPGFGVTLVKKDLHRPYPRTPESVGEVHAGSILYYLLELYTYDLPPSPSLSRSVHRQLHRRNLTKHFQQKCLFRNNVKLNDSFSFLCVSNEFPQFKLITT